MNVIKKAVDLIVKHKAVIIGSLVAVIVLSVAFAMGGKPEEKTNFSEQTQSDLSSVSTPDEAKTERSDPESDEPRTEKATDDKSENKSEKSDSKEKKKSSKSNSESKKTDGSKQESSSAKEKSRSESKSQQSDSQSSSSAKKDKYNTDPIPKGKPKPVEPQEQVIEDNTKYCTISISCATILDNMDNLDPDKVDLVPEDGWILKPKKVSFNEGESVFDVLQRVCEDEKIHMEFSFNPMYNSAYIEGINNLYEFDCGGQSGWMYRVDGWFPNYGVSRYQLKGNDTIEFKYTCNGLGADIGADMNWS